MKLIHSTLLAGAAALGLGAFALPALGKDPAMHEMTIQLPGGGSETIEYTGPAAPKVRFDQEPLLLAWPGPLAFGLDPSIIALDRVAAAMDRQVDEFWREAGIVAPMLRGPNINQVDLQNLAPGTSTYSVVSESFGDRVCSRVTEITTPPNGGKPEIVSRTSGNCDPSQGGAPMTTSPQSGARSIAAHAAFPANSVPRMAL